LFGKRGKHLVIHACEDLVEGVTANKPRHFQEGKYKCIGKKHMISMIGHTYTSLFLPDDTGFRLDLQSKAKYLVLSVHFGAGKRMPETHLSGYKVTLTEKRIGHIDCLVAVIRAGCRHFIKLRNQFRSKKEMCSLSFVHTIRQTTVNL